MNDAERQDLKPGDRVRVRDDAGNEADYHVKAAPWQLGHGEWVIGLRGISGGYALSRVVGVAESREFEEREISLGAAQQFRHMAVAACESLGMPLDETSPAEIREKIDRMASVGTMIAAEADRLRAALEMLAQIRHVSGSAQAAFRSNLRVVDAVLAGADVRDVATVEAIAAGTWKPTTKEQ